ncbi:hypothetical protein ACFLVO_03490 [Chloroflexota bacterium]
MMKKKEIGQALIMVLILLGIGALLVVPSLRLTDTILGSTQDLTMRNRGLYACEAAQEQVMWMLYHGTLVTDLPSDGDSMDITVDVCGTLVDLNITMRAVELEGGVVLSSNHTIMPTKAVDPTTAVSDSDDGPFTYTISLDQVSSDTTRGLDAVYDILSDEFKAKADDAYIWNSSEISDDGENWVPIDNPDFLTNSLLRWPATGSFGEPFRTFMPGQVKYLRFSLASTFNHNDEVVCNWVVLKVGDGVDPENDVFTLSGPQAAITVGDPVDEFGEPLTACTDAGGVFEVYKSTDPSPLIIPPLQVTPVEYTVHISNMDNNQNFVTRIEDYLPPGFSYVTGSTNSLITDNQDPHEPQLVNRNGVDRYLLLWDSVQLGAEGYKIEPGEEATLIFTSLAEQGVSGNYYNEIIVLPKNFPDPVAFNYIDGFPESGYGETYSWNTGVVIVPAYDAEADADGVSIDTNLALDPDGVSIISWHVD